MAPTKRKATTQSRRKTADATVADSSPTRSKKRKVSTPRTKRKTPSPTPEPELEPVEVAEASDDEPSDGDLIESVISYLGTSKEPVSVASQHSNELAPNEKVRAFAKIAGKDWTYYVTDQVVNIGRPPDSNPGSSPEKEFAVHIDLGPSKIVSRHHASIYYDGENEGWFVRVNGRNGVRVDNSLLKKGGRAQLHSGAILEIATTQMMFVMPNERVLIDSYFLDRAKSLATGETVGSDRDTEPERIETGYATIAPAPADFKRATPPPERKESKMSPIYGRGMLMESTQEIDYSRDSAKDLKPPYSYAHMIAQAIFANPEEKLTLSNIYNYIAGKYAFYRHSNSGWQNSIRHNLSLNKAFQKVPRRTDEPGKGMKWQIAPEYRQEYLKKMQRKAGNSSNPSSPAAKDINPNFRGPNGQNLGYDTSMVSSFSAREAGPKMNMSFPPYPQIGSHMPSFASQPQTSTPIRSRALPNTDELDSPLPHYPSARRPVYAPSSAAPHQSPTNLTLSSSYLDTPFHPSQRSMVTPAPLRQNPRLAPPSTLVAPSKFMPESSPSGPGLFWKGFLGGATPGPLSAFPPDMSPVKVDPDREVMSSSPPPVDAQSPSKPSRSRKIEEEEPKNTLSETNGNGAKQAIPNTMPVEEEESEDDGFDLAKGFAPITSFSSQRAAANH